MKKFLVRDVMAKLLLLCLVITMPVLAADAGQKEAIAMVDKALAYAKAHGKDKLVEEVNNKNPDFSQGELYIVVASMDGVRIAHGSNPKLVGKSVTENPDVDGKYYGKEMVEIVQSKGKGWVDYKFKNPVSGKIEPKSSYVAKGGDDFFIFAGIYKN